MTRIVLAAAAIALVSTSASAATPAMPCPAPTDSRVRIVPALADFGPQLDLGRSFGPRMTQPTFELFPSRTAAHAPQGAVTVFAIRF